MPIVEPQCETLWDKEKGNKRAQEREREMEGGG